MGKSFSRQRELENKFLTERDNLFKEFSCAKKEIQVNFNDQKIELEEAFHQEIGKLYKIHDTQIKTIKLQMRDSQLGDLQEKLKGKLSRHLSWPIAQSTPRHSQESSMSACVTCGSKEDREHCSNETRKSTEEWMVLVRHLKFALNNQKSLFEKALLEEKLKMQGHLEREREVMEEKIFKRLNKTLQNALKERDVLLQESHNLQSVSKNLLKDMVLNNKLNKKKKARGDFMMDSDTDDNNSGDSGVEEKCKKTDKRGNYWRMKYLESQRKHLRKIKEDEDNQQEKEKQLMAEFEKSKQEYEKKRLAELNEVEIRATKELQKLIKEERQIHKEAIKDLNNKLITISSENDELKDELEEMNLLLGSDVKELHGELIEKLQVLKEIVSQE